MKNTCIMLMILSCLGLASCSSVPKPIAHKFSSQNTLEAPEHWGILAKDFANDIVTTMVANPMLILQKDGSEDLNNMYMKPSDERNMMSEVPPIYLQPIDSSAFGRTFHSYLITEITKLGYPITHTPKGAVIARLSLNKVYHNADRIASPWPAAGTTASLLGYGVYKIIDANSSAFPEVLAAGIAYDLLTTSGQYLFPTQVPNTEVVLTFTVSKDARILSRHTQAYYVNEEDFSHYNDIVDYAGQESRLKPVKFSVTN